MERDIFISYSRNDKVVVLPYIEQISKALGRNCWIDLKGIESGVEFEEVIIKAIDECKVVLFMLSDSSLRSKWTKREVIYAEDEGKRIVPILVDGDKLRGWFKFHFGNVDFIDIRSDEQREKLIGNLRTWLGDDYQSAKVPKKNRRVVDEAAKHKVNEETKLEVGESIRKKGNKAQEENRKAKNAEKAESTSYISQMVTNEIQKNVQIPNTNSHTLKWGIGASITVAFIILIALTLPLGNVQPDVELRNRLDSMSYAMGIANANGLKEYLQEKLNVDTTNLDKFKEGLLYGEELMYGQKKSRPSYEGIQQKAFETGIDIANQIVRKVNQHVYGEDSTKSISTKRFIAGFIDGIDENYRYWNTEKARAIAEELMEIEISSILERKFGNNKEEGEVFLETNKAKEGIFILPSGVQYKILKQGSGQRPSPDSEVTYHYEGRLLNGTVFDSSYKRGKPVVLKCNDVIKGLTDALVNMPVGSTWEVYIPQQLAYGYREQGDIKPFSLLIFKIELIGINNNH